MSSGGSATAVSATTSTEVPPAPNRMIGPNSGSSPMPTISSWAPGREIIACTVKPSMEASGALAATRSRMPWAALAAACGVRMPSTTPPTSDLWLMSRDRSLTATAGLRVSRSAAMVSASLTLWATMVSTTGTPKAASAALASGSVSTVRPSATTSANSLRAAAMSVGTCGAEGGVCISSRWAAL